MSPFGRITIIDPRSSPTLVRSTMTLHPYFQPIFSTHLKVLYCCKTQILKETFATLLKQIRLTYQLILTLSSMFMLGRTTRQMNLKPIRHFSNNFMIFLLGIMKKCQGQTHPLWSMKLKPIPWLKLSGKTKEIPSMEGYSY